MCPNSVCVDCHCTLDIKTRNITCTTVIVTTIASFRQVMQYFCAAIMQQCLYSTLNLAATIELNLSHLCKIELNIEQQGSAWNEGWSWWRGYRDRNIDANQKCLVRAQPSCMEDKVQRAAIRLSKGKTARSRFTCSPEWWRSQTQIHGLCWEIILLREVVNLKILWGCAGERHLLPPQVHINRSLWSFCWVFMKRWLSSVAALMKCLSAVDKEKENKIKLYLGERCQYINKDQRNAGQHAGTLKSE